MMGKGFRRIMRCVGMAVVIGAWTWSGAFAQQGATRFKVTVDEGAHRAFGLHYPVTYVFRIPEGSSGLSGQYRYSTDGDWSTLETRRAGEIFNGVAAARFDYGAGIAYLSVPFSAGSDSLHLRVVAGGSEIPMNYLGMARYYDNRRAAVTVTLDDWNYGTGAYFDAAASVLSGAGMHATVGIITYGNPNWSQIQGWYDTGYIEPASHSRTHPCSAGDYSENGHAFEIRGSRDDILANLSLRHPYVTTYIEPCGYADAQVRQNVVGAGYLVERGYPVPPVQNGFSSWVEDGAYGRALYSFDTGAWYGHEDSNLLTQGNASFDSAYRAGEIYHLMDHPHYGLWYNGSYLSRHIGYVSNRPDVWYASFGGLYLYHFVLERGLVAVYAGESNIPLPTEIITNPPTPPAPPPPLTASLWGDGATPQYSTAGDTSPIEVGVKFRSDVAGYVTGVRFYKDASNTGTHHGHVWSSDGTLWAEAVFTGETASGWQTATFSAPVAIAANTTYIVSYHTEAGHYSLSRPYFNTGYSNAPLYAYATGEVAGGNGVYRYGPNRSFPEETWEAGNYWVDVVFTTQAPSGPIATPIPPVPPPPPPPPPAPAPSLWGDGATPQYSTAGDTSPIEVGVKFRSDVAGYVTGVRFYKDASNTGTHHGHVWSSDGTLWAEAVFTGETASGWQTATFSAPVAIAANTTYIVSYHTEAGHYSLSRPYFNTGYSNAPLYAYATGEVAGGNGVYRYGPNRSFPDQTWEGSNYWVDVIFVASPPPGP